MTSTARVLSSVLVVLLPLLLKGVPLAAQVGGSERVRLEEPRIPPLAKGEGNSSQEAVLARMEREGRIGNIYRSLAHHPELFDAWIPFAGYIFNQSTLPPRHREMAILRIGWLCYSEYEFGQHARIGKRIGLSGEEIERITNGPEAEGWTAFERVLLRAVDELHRDAFVSNDTWNALAAEYDTRQLMDLVFTVAEYTLVSMALNTFGVQLEPDVPGFPEGAGR